MRAREFIREQSELPPETANPMQHGYDLPGLPTSNPYNNYRFGVAIARARSDAEPDTVNPYKPEWSPNAALGKDSFIVGFNSGIAKVIDKALEMTDTPGGKHLVTTPTSQDPDDTNTVSPLPSFGGYPRKKK